nr:LPS assembly protein LptD [Thermoanaerobaculia bacterium]
APPSTAPTEPVAQAPAAAPAQEEGQISFQLPFTKEKGGGVATGKAGKLTFETEKTAVLSGGVDLAYKDLKLKAQEVEVNLATKVVVARGDVVIDQGPQRLTGEVATYDLETRTGTLHHATASVSPEIYFRGEELEKISDDLYTIEKGVLTACTDPVPDWSFSVRKARIQVEGYAHLKGAAMRVKKAPILYLPRLIWPAKRDRASGFLIPQPGYSNQRGPSLSLAYFQTLGRSYDTTFYGDLYGFSFANGRYFGFGDEFRYAPSSNSHGEINAYVVRDPQRRSPDPANPGAFRVDTEYRWKVALDHTSERLPFGMRGALSYRDYSDFDFVRDFERNIDKSALRSIYSRGFASGNWGLHSLNVLADSRETFISRDAAGREITVTQRRLPKVNYSLRPVRFGRLPLYFNLDGSAAYLQLERSTSYAGNYGRFDLTPNFKVPVLALPWLSATVNGGGRYTWYGDSVCRANVPGSSGGQLCRSTQQEFTGDSLSRLVPTASADIVGPSFSRIISANAGRFSKFKHIVEPRFSYGYVGTVDEKDSARTPLFDEVDSVGTTNVGRVALVNRLLAKPADGKGSASEILSIEVARAYSFDDTVPLSVLSDDRGHVREKQQWGPITSLIRFQPGGPTYFRGQLVYNTQASTFSQWSLSGGVGFWGATAEATWLRVVRSALVTDPANPGELLGPVKNTTQTDQVQLWGSVPIVPRRLTLQGQISYNLTTQDVQKQSIGLRYLSQCFGFELVAREFRSDFLGADNNSVRRDRDFRFVLTLKNVGTFLDLSSRSSTGDEN